jgi:hypothetical protein
MSFARIANLFYKQLKLYIFPPRVLALFWKDSVHRLRKISCALVSTSNPLMTINNSQFDKDDRKLEKSHHIYTYKITGLTWINKWEWNRQSKLVFQHLSFLSNHLLLSWVVKTQIRSLYLCASRAILWRIVCLVNVICFQLLFMFYFHNWPTKYTMTWEQIRARSSAQREFNLNLRTVHSKIAVINARRSSRNLNKYKSRHT